MSRRPRFFLLVTIYNVLSGFLILIYPQIIFQWSQMELINHDFVIRGMGMFIMVFAYAYWLVYQNPIRYVENIMLGIIGRIAGTAGWVYLCMIQVLPASSLWVILCNDLLWLPGFLFYYNHYRKYLGYSMS